MKEQSFHGLPFMLDSRAAAEQNNEVLKHLFKGRIKGYFLIDIKKLGYEGFGLE